MELAGALDLVELGLQARNPLFDQPPVGFELGFARASQKAESSALALEMGPGPHQPALFDRSNGRARLAACPSRVRARRPKISRIKPVRVEHLGVPGLFQIALLHRRKRAIHYHQAGLDALDQACDLLDLSGADIGCRADRGDRHDAGLQHIEVDGAGETDRFVELGLGGPQAGGRMNSGSAQRPAAQIRFNDDGTPAA